MYSLLTMANIKKDLKTRVTDNHGYTYSAWIKFEEYCVGTFHNPETGKCDLKKRCDRWVFQTSAGGSWYLSDVLDAHGALYIDFGQRWFITNLDELMAEARKVL